MRTRMTRSINVLLEGEPRHQDAAIRTEACIKRVEEEGVELERLAVANANWRRGQGKEKMAGWLNEFGGGIEAVISNNDAMAIGALDRWRNRSGPALCP